MGILVAVVLAYLIGSVPFGFLCGKLICGVDIRTVGSGNIGATNVGRVCGWHWFVIVLALDFAKGFGPAFFAWQVAQVFGEPAWSPVLLTILTGVAAILGHLWPLWLRFQGGKGVATGLGVVTALAPLAGWWPLAAAVGMFVVSVAVFRIVSLGSMLAAVTYGGTQLAMLADPTGQGLPVAIFSVVVPLLVIWRHRANLGRLMRGEESRIGQKKADQQAAEFRPEG